MKKKLIILLGIMLLLSLGGTMVAALSGRGNDEKHKFTIVTSFYPMYVLAQNLVEDLDVQVINLTDYKLGCLHDYQLTTEDMQKLESADVFLINGGGMESFTQDVLNTYPDLTVINASEGLEFLPSEGQQHEGESHLEGTVAQNSQKENQTEGSHDAEENNAHVWLNMNNYIQQIQTVQDNLANIDKANASKYQENGNLYQEKVKALKDKLETILKGVEGTKVVIFHNSFAYLAQELGLDVVYTVNLDGDYALSAGDVAETIDKVNRNQVSTLFTEEQYSSTIADSIASETGAKVYIMDSLVTGEPDKDAYLTAMNKNIKVLQEAFGK